MRSCVQLAGIISICVASAAFGQTAQLDLLERSVDVTSGVVHNDTDTAQVLFSHLVALPEAASMQLGFGRTKLAEGCTLRLTSLADGAMQHHTAATLTQWQGYSAWFNGSMVFVELIAEANTAASHVTIESAVHLLQLGDARSICGSTDDRELSSDPRAARHFPVGCTAWLIDDANHTFLSAGHCVDGGVAGDVTQFNVPLSDPDGNWNHPGPEDQYAMDPASLQAYYGGIGNDWAYYGCFPNTETGLTPYQAQGDFYILADAPPPVAGQPITITGFGSTSSPVNPQWNLVQKTHTGPFAYLDGTTIGYTTDTSGGNSGSAVLDEDTGTAIGIHTNAGCDSGGGYNHGCAIHNAGLQNALANPQGVCIPTIMYLGFPDGRPESVLPGVSLDLVFQVEAGDEAPVDVAVVLVVDGASTTLPAASLGDDLYEVTIGPQTCDTDVSFYLEALGDGGTTVRLPYGAPDDRFNLLIGNIVTTALLAESFEAGLPAGWTQSGLWHAADGNCAPTNDCDGGNVMYFGVDSSCTYDTGNPEAGSLSTPAIPLAGVGGDIVLTYCSVLQTENLQDYDRGKVYANGVEVEQADESASWEMRELNLGSIAGDTLTITWTFDTGDDIYNDYPGWHIDGVRIVASTADCDDTPACTGDANGDGDVGTTDLLMVIADWGQTDSPADVDGDGTVNASDILVILGGWGPC